MSLSPPFGQYLLMLGTFIGIWYMVESVIKYSSMGIKSNSFYICFGGRGGVQQEALLTIDMHLFSLYFLADWAQICPRIGRRGIPVMPNRIARGRQSHSDRKSRSWGNTEDSSWQCQRLYPAPFWGAHHGGTRTPRGVNDRRRSI